MIQGQRRVLEGQAEDRPSGVRVWWLLLDCGCTAMKPYTNPCTITALWCGWHPESDNPPPMERGQGPGQAWIKKPGER